MGDFKRDLVRKHVTMDLRIFILAITLPIITANILAGNQCDTCGSRVNQVFRNLKAEGESDATIDLLKRRFAIQEAIVRFGSGLGGPIWRQLSSTKTLSVSFVRKCPTKNVLSCFGHANLVLIKLIKSLKL